MAKSTKRDREERERLRRYRARQQVHEQGMRARRRDNVIALIAGIGIIAAATVAQIAYFELGAGSSSPEAVDDSSDAVEPSLNEPTSAPLPGVDGAVDDENDQADESVAPEGTPTPVP